MLLARAKLFRLIGHGYRETAIPASVKIREDPWLFEGEGCAHLLTLCCPERGHFFVAQSAKKRSTPYLAVSWQFAWTLSRAGVRHVLVELASPFAAPDSNERLAAAHLIEDVIRFVDVDDPPVFGGGTGPPGDDPLLQNLSNTSEKSSGGFHFGSVGGGVNLNAGADIVGGDKTTTIQGMKEFPRQPDNSADYIVIPLFYGTDRKRSGKDNAGKYYSGEPGRLDVGMCEVAIPSIRV